MVPHSGAEDCGKGAAEPVDLAQLASQTFGDKGLQREVLELFLEQARRTREALRTTGPDECGRLAHRIEGSAKAIGAFELASAAAGLAEAPQSADAKECFLRRLDEVVAHIARRML